MKVLVLGAGVTGVTTAYYLRRQGADVTVVDRQPGPGLETSFANGGHLSFGHALPWATPEAPLQLLTWGGRQNAPLRLRARWDPTFWRWGAKFLRNCTPGRYRANTNTLRRLATFSQTCFGNLIAELPDLQFGHRTDGVLTVFRTPRAFDREAVRVARYAGNADHFQDPEQLLTPDECVKIEPALVPAYTSGKIAGGIFAASAATGNAYQFTNALAQTCQNTGVEFCFGVEVTNISRISGTITGAETSQGYIKADAVVLALGSNSPVVARSVGLDLPIIPVKGYSVTLPTSGSLGPTLGILDAERKVVMAPVDDGLRAAGTAEFLSYDQTIDPIRAQAIADVVWDLFPQLGEQPPRLANLKPWAGLRPMTPDGPPLLGPIPSPYGCANLFLNTGHGPLGWTLACGSAKLVADWVDCRPPTDPSGITFSRFG
jgi:D-amino-acid dehydrogenase